MTASRREFLVGAAASAAASVAAPPPEPVVQTVRGPVPVSQLGPVLTHEHILVDFIGAAEVNPGRYNTAEVIRAALPKLLELKAAGCRTLVDCTPAFLGRDPALLRRLSEASGVHILTNTGYYGAVEGKYLPPHALEETAAQLAARWIAEHENGIDGTGIRPAFQKIGVNKGPLRAVDRKLIEAACACFRKAGLRMHVHTGDGAAAMDTLQTLKRAGVEADAWVWVHAQSEPDRALHILAAKAGGWVSFDGVNEKSMPAHLAAVREMASAGLLGRVLVSQDSGWYNVGEPEGGEFRPYTLVWERFVPALGAAGFTDAQIRTLTVENPARVLSPKRPAAGSARPARR